MQIRRPLFPAGETSTAISQIVRRVATVASRGSRALNSTDCVRSLVNTRRNEFVVGRATRQGNLFANGRVAFSNADAGRKACRRGLHAQQRLVVRHRGRHLAEQWSDSGQMDPVLHAGEPPAAVVTLRRRTFQKYRRQQAAIAVCERRGYFRKNVVNYYAYENLLIYLVGSIAATAIFFRGAAAA